MCLCFGSECEGVAAKIDLVLSWRISQEHNRRSLLMKASSCVVSSNIPLAQERHVSKHNTHGAEKYALPSERDYEATWQRA